VRIIEFPRYSTFAQSFPNTIPFSEGIGFIADVDDSSKNDVDYVFYVTAHEVGHQWWAHQVAGADVEGSNMLSESLAQYSSITVMEHQYGPEKIKKFLKQEMDKYLTARSNESEKEKPLGLVDLGQGYILYQKGGLIMHSLGKYLGEDSVNHALHNFLTRFAFKAPPYPTTCDFVACIRAVTPDSMQYMITDDFERIIVYDNKVTDLQAEKTGEGYTAKLSVDIKKLQVDSTGHETQTACNDYIDIAIYKDRNTVLKTIRYKLKDGPATLNIPLSTKPYKAVIDPSLLLIDKKPEDNEFRLGDEKVVVR
jgi:aminopeptidase N